MQDLNNVYENIYSVIRKRLEDSGRLSDKEVLELIDDEIETVSEKNHIPLKQKLDIRGRAFNALRRLGILQELIDANDITEIMVNGCRDIFVERKGRILKWDKSFDSEEELENIIQQIVGRVNRTVNVSNPIADARLEDGSRVHVVLPPVALDGPVITIRKFPEAIDMDGLLSYGAINREAADFLKRLVRAGYNIFISGGTNSGKTTFLNALSAYIPEDERVITIEDSAELQLKHIRNIVRLEVKNSNIQGGNAINIAALIRASLRMNPDRIVVGEVRGAEALDMLQAMNTGHDGSLSTGHGNSERDMLSRIETMVLSGAALPLNAIRGQIAGAIDIIVHLGRLRDRSRKVLSISEVGEFKNGEIELNKLYEFQEIYQKDAQDAVCGELKRTGELQNRAKLYAAGDRLF